MGHGRQGGVVGGERDASNLLDGAQEDLDEVVLVDVENIVVETLAIIVDLGDGHSVGEGGDVQHVEEGGLGRSDLSTSRDELQVGDNLNGTTGNLGGDTESLEEGGLAGLHTGVSGGNVDIGGGDGTSTGRGGDTVVKNDTPDLLEVFVGENESDVAWEKSVLRRGVDGLARQRTLDVGKETLVLREVGHQDADSATNHGVLSHEDGGATTEGLADLVHLLGRDLLKHRGQYGDEARGGVGERTLSTATMKMDLLSSNKPLSLL